VIRVYMGPDMPVFKSVQLKSVTEEGVVVGVFSGVNLTV
jgi:hypothetical protein